MSAFNVGPSQRDPSAFRNPYLDEIDAAANNAHAQLSPGAQDVLKRAGAPLPGAQPAQAPGAPQPQIASPSTMRPNPITPVAKTPQEIGAEGEVARLTAPQPMDPALVHTKQNTGTAGVNQIHNPWARIPLQILAGVGETFAPRLAAALPGTESHHQLLVGEAEGALKQQQGIREAEEKAQTAAATQGHLEAESANQMAQATRERQAPHPTITTDKGIMQWNPATGRFDIQAGNAPVKEEMEGKTITTDQGIMQWNPQTKSYDIKAGDAPEKEAAEKTLQDSDGVWYKVGHDNTAVPITLNGQPFKGKMPAAAGDDFAQFYQKYLKEKGLPDSATNEKKARAEWSASSQAPERPPQSMMLVPGQNGEMTAQVVRPGSTIAAGAVTPAGASSMNVPTSQTRTMTETAPKVIDLANRVSQLVDQQQQALGPAASRWNEFMAGKVGAPNPEFTKLRTDVGLLQTALMRMHVGSRGGEQMMEHFRALIDTSKQSPENLRAALGEIVEYAKAVGGQHNTEASAGGGKAAEGGYQVGHKYQGMTYLGGPVNDQANWKR